MVVQRKKLNPPQLAKVWGCSIKKVKEFIASGELRAINLASKSSTRPRYVIDLADIDSFERARQVVPSEPPAPRQRRRAQSGKQYV